MHTCKGSSDLLEAQDRGQGLEAFGFKETDGGPVPFEGLLIEELDPTQGNGTGHPGPAGDIGAKEEILPKFLFRDPIRGLMVVFSEFPYGSSVGFLGPGREASKLHVLYHTFS